MQSSTKKSLVKTYSDVESFATYLQKCSRIIAVLGAGLSASSGLPTFRGAGGLWRSYDAKYLATPEAFELDPGLVWQFYSYRRHMALNAQPNRAHYALAELARRVPGFVALSQNVDGLSPRAGHPEGQLKLLHGSLFDVKCVDEETCGYVRRDDFSDPICPALAIPQEAEHNVPGKDKAQLNESFGATIAEKVSLIKGLDIASAEIPLSTIPRSSLPQCPKCKTSLLRPGVVWFGEALPEDVLTDVDNFISGIDPNMKADGKSAAEFQTRSVDLCLVIGTSSQVHPAAGYAQEARYHGAKVAVINIDWSDAPDLRKGDWFFQGDAAEIVPDILRSVIGDMKSGNEDEIKGQAHGE